LSISVHIVEHIYCTISCYLFDLINYIQQYQRSLPDSVEQENTVFDDCGHVSGSPTNRIVPDTAVDAPKKLEPTGASIP
jgi:hypothetical protein